MTDPSTHGFNDSSDQPSDQTLARAGGGYNINILSSVKEFAERVFIPGGTNPVSVIKSGIGAISAWKKGEGTAQGFDAYLAPKANAEGVLSDSEQQLARAQEGMSDALKKLGNG